MGTLLARVVHNDGVVNVERRWKPVPHLLEILHRSVGIVGRVVRRALRTEKLKHEPALQRPEYLLNNRATIVLLATAPNTNNKVLERELEKVVHKGSLRHLRLLLSLNKNPVEIKDKQKHPGQLRLLHSQIEPTSCSDHSGAIAKNFSDLTHFCFGWAHIDANELVD